MTSAKKLLIKTLPYILAKSILGAIPTVISAIVLVIWIASGVNTPAPVSVLMFILWILAGTALNYFFMHMLGYRVKAGHIAVTVEAAGANRIPPNQVAWGNRHVDQIYPTSGSYFSMKKQISRAIREIQSCFGRSDIRTGASAMQILTEPLLLRFMRYMDGCCIAWIFLKRRQDMYRSAAESIAIYAQNRKALLQNAIKIMTKSVIYAAAVMLILFLPFGILFRALGINTLTALWLCILCAWTVKYAVLDSYIMIRTITNFIKASRHISVSVEMCGEYCKMSDTYRRIWKKMMANRR